MQAEAGYEQLEDNKQASKHSMAYAPSMTRYIYASSQPSRCLKPVRTAPNAQGCDQKQAAVDMATLTGMAESRLIDGVKMDLH
jgi:hypothetical protein